MAAQRLEVQRMVQDEKEKAYTAKKKYGVVFVHGIGSQTQSSTLREQANPLIRWLRHWHAKAASEQGAGVDRTDEFAVISSHLSYGADIDGPPRMQLHIPEYEVPSQRRRAAVEIAEKRRAETNETPPVDVRRERYGSQTWVLTEGWWAARLVAPSLRVMLEWSSTTVRLAVKRLIRAFREQDPRNVFRDTTGRRQLASRPLIARVIERISGSLVVALYSVGGGLLIPVVWLLWLISQIPIPGLENFVVMKLIRPLVLDGIGDVYTYLYDEGQALHMRRSVEEAVTWLVKEEECDHVVVVAHSGGVVIAHDALGNRASDPADCVHDISSLKSVKALVTVGGALNNAWLPGVGPEPPLRLRDNLCGHTNWTDIWAAYDLVSGGSITHTPMPNEDVTVTNSLSVLADHGGYWDNFEEYAPRIAQLIESPDDRHRSRFWDPIRVEWAERRRDRVTTLVGWRLTAFALFFAALWFKLFNGEVQQLFSGVPEGQTLWGAVAQLFNGRIAADGRLLMDLAERIPVVGGLLGGIKDAAAFAPDLLKVLAADAVGLLAWSAISAFAYMAVVSTVFGPWSLRESIRSIVPPVSGATSQRTDIAIHTTAVIGTLTTAVIGVAALNLSDITFGQVFVGLLVAIPLSIALHQFGRHILTRDAGPTEEREAEVARQGARA